MARRWNTALAVCTGGLLAIFSVPPMWSRLMEDQGMVDVRDQAEKSQLVFRGQVVAVTPDTQNKTISSWRDGKPVNTNFVASIQIDRFYRGNPAGNAAIHFSFGGIEGINGHDCFDFRPGQLWLFFAMERNGMTELLDDCTGALGISQRLGSKLSRPDWKAQMEADFIAGLEDTDQQSRVFSLQRLGGLHLASSRPALREALKEREGPEADWAVYALLRTGDYTALPKVNAALATGDPSLVSVIDYELRNVKDPSAVPALLDIAKNAPNDYSRLEAMISLVWILRDPRVVPVLGAALSSSNEQIRYMALEGLETIAKSSACKRPPGLGKNGDRAIERAVASCTVWWEREGIHQTWVRD